MVIKYFKLKTHSGKTISNLEKLMQEISFREPPTTAGGDPADEISSRLERLDAELAEPDLTTAPADPGTGDPGTATGDDPAATAPADPAPAASPALTTSYGGFNVLYSETKRTTWRPTWLPKIPGTLETKLVVSGSRGDIEDVKAHIRAKFEKYEVRDVAVAVLSYTTKPADQESLTAYQAFVTQLSGRNTELKVKQIAKEVNEDKKIYVGSGTISGPIADIVEIRNALKDNDHYDVQLKKESLTFTK